MFVTVNVIGALGLPICAGCKSLCDDTPGLHIGNDLDRDLVRIVSVDLELDLELRLAVREIAARATRAHPAASHRRGWTEPRAGLDQRSQRSLGDVHQLQVLGCRAHHQ